MEINLESKHNNSELELDMLDIDEETLLGKQRIECMLLSAPSDNSVLSLTLNHKKKMIQIF